MGKLSTGARNKLKSTEFALPGSRKYPVNNKAHAANAKARASEMANKGKISTATKSKIDSKANKVLGKSKDKDAYSK